MGRMHLDTRVKFSRLCLRHRARETLLATSHGPSTMALARLGAARRGTRIALAARASWSRRSALQWMPSPLAQIGSAFRSVRRRHQASRQRVTVMAARSCLAPPLAARSLRCSSRASSAGVGDARLRKSASRSGECARRERRRRRRISKVEGAFRRRRQSPCVVNGLASACRRSLARHASQ